MIINFYNLFHLGDHVFNFIIFYQLKNYIEAEQVYLHYYCNEEYISQLSEFKCSSNISIYKIEGENYKSGINLHPLALGNHKLRYMDLIIVDFYEALFKRINFPVCIFKSLIYFDDELECRYKRLPDQYKNLQILILNSTARSGQYAKDDKLWENFIKTMNSLFKIATSEKVQNILCTSDHNLSVKDIAAISTTATYIIAVNSGCVPGLFNNYTLNSVREIYYFDNISSIASSKFKKCTDLRHIEIVNFDDIELKLNPKIGHHF